jgi:hypothetical protein
VQQLDIEPSNKLTEKSYNKAVKVTPERKGGDVTVYWSEDFANGPDSENGTWTTDGDLGDLWFYTFPVGAENGYDPEATLDGYGDFLPNYFGTRDVCNSPTRDNGVMMIDWDRWNSTATSPDDPPGPNTTSNIIPANSLESPSFSLEGVDFAIVTFYQYLRVCCANASFASMDFSVDGGATWIPYDVRTPYGDVNSEIDVFVQVNISDVLQQADDLSNCKMRFNGAGGQTHYFWSIDDINITSLPENDLAAGATWYNNYYALNAGFNAGTELAVDYYDAFEYLNTPEYLTRDFNFAMEVTNAGALAQTGVQLVVTVTTPGGTVLEDFTSDPITLEAAVTDTLEIGPISFGEGMGEIPLEEGQYTFDFEVIQNEEDEQPEDNVGNTRGCRISTDASNDGFAIYRNDGDGYNGAYTTLGQDVIWSTPYVFAQPQVENSVITHVEAVFQFNADFAETQAGELVYFNVRSGSVLEEDPEVPETITTVFFDSENPLEYEDGDLEFEITEADIWDADVDGTPYTVWASFELPNPIMINAGEVYQAEYRVPPAGAGIVFPPVSGNQEQFAGTLYDFADGAWFFLGTNAIPTRFRTTAASAVEEVTYESGVQLLQNWPNPFNDVTRIQYRLDETSDVTFEVFDMSGRLVYAEDHGRIPAGIAQTFEFSSKSLSAGVYTYSIVANGERVTRKLTIE